MNVATVGGGTAGSPSLTVTSSIAKLTTSSFRIVPVAVSDTSMFLAPVGVAELIDSPAVNVSSISAIASGLRVTVNVCPAVLLAGKVTAATCVAES